jgi:hypothetical protein
MRLPLKNLLAAKKTRATYFLQSATAEATVDGHLEVAVLRGQRGTQDYDAIKE